MTSSASRTDSPAISCCQRGKALRAYRRQPSKFDGSGRARSPQSRAQGRGEKVAEKLDGRNVVVLRQASETGQLFGSVSVRDIIASFEADGVTISRSQILLDAPIKTIGKHAINIAVHPEVEVSVSVTVARSADEAERINRGEDISTRQEDQDAAAEALAAAGEFFDPDAQHDDEAPAPAESRSKAFALRLKAQSPASSYRGRAFYFRKQPVPRTSRSRLEQALDFEFEPFPSREPISTSIDR